MWIGGGGVGYVSMELLGVVEKCSLDRRAQSISCLELHRDVRASLQHNDGDGGAQEHTTTIHEPFVFSFHVRPLSVASDHLQMLWKC